VAKDRICSEGRGEEGEGCERGQEGGGADRLLGSTKGALVGPELRAGLRISVDDRGRKLVTP
jgi:hypothetical protein